jgi:hypothetical protein
MGHYTRWDLVSLNLREEGWEPIQTLNRRSIPTGISSEKIEKVAQKFKLSPDKLEAILKELEGLS